MHWFEMQLQNLPAKNLGIAGLVMFLLSSSMEFYGFSALIHNQVKSKLALKKGSLIRKIWSKFEDPIDFKVYMFNVTNPMEVQVGKKPILNEIGPYFFEEYKEKLDLKDHDEDDTVFYNPRDYWIFKQEKSGGLTGEEIITIPNALLLGMALAVEREKPAALLHVNKAIPFLFGNPTSIFTSASAKKILFEGVPLYCNVTNLSAKLICSEIRKKEKEFHYFGDDIFGFSFFGKRNYSLGGRFQVKRGIKDIKDLGRVVGYNGEKQMSVWSGDECNSFKGTDSTIFAPFVTREDNLAAFSPDICRSAESENLGLISYKGIDGYLFTADFGDMSTDPKLKCFCTTPDTCMKKGVHDLTRCTGVPIVGSLPHFYDAAPEYQNGVIGLNPIRDIHELMMVIEPLTATPLVGYKRMQFNLPLHPINKIDLMKDISTVLFPIFWVQEGMELDEKYLVQVRKIFKVIKIADVLLWIVMVAGGGLGAAGAMLGYRKKTNEMVVEVSPTTKKNSINIAPLDLQTPPRY